MNLEQALKMAVRSVSAQKVRTALTMLGIVIGVASVVIMVSVVQGSNRKTMEYYEKLGSNKIEVNVFTQARNDFSRLLTEFCAKKGNVIEGVTPQGYVNGPIVYQTKNTDRMEPGTPAISLGNSQFSICNNFEIARGRDISYLDVKRHYFVVVLGDKVAKYLFDAVDPIGKKVQIAGKTFTVIGVYKAKDANSEYSMDNMAVVAEGANGILNQGQPITSFVVKAKNRATTNRAITELSAFLSTVAGQDAFSVFSNDQFADDSNKQNKMMSMVLGGIAGISLLVGGIGIMNIMLVTVSERTREIGIRKAIGAPRSAILLQFLVESSFVCGTGGILGIALGVLGSLVAGKLLLKLFILPDAALVAGAFLFSVTLGIGFGMYPAIKASGLAPVEALRSN